MKWGVATEVQTQPIKQQTYDTLVEQYHILQESLRKEQQEKVRLEETLMDYIQAFETYRQRIFKISYNVVSNMPCLENRPKNLYCCIDDHDNIK